MGNHAHRRRSEWLLIALAITAAAVFVRLGVWQLARLVERREVNAAKSAALATESVRLDGSTPSSRLTSDSIQWRRVQLEGRWVPEQEVVIRGRAYLGTPGVQVATLFHPVDMAPVLVLRGWLPAADGVSADLAGHSIRRDTGVVSIRGLAIPYEHPGPLPTRLMTYADRERPVLGTLDFEAVSGALGIVTADWMLQLLPETDSKEENQRTAGTTAESIDSLASIRRLPPPMLNDGPHALYAFQWFGFAAIALAGAFLLPRAAQRSAVPPERNVAPGPKGDES